MRILDISSMNREELEALDMSILAELQSRDQNQNQEVA